MSNDYHWCYNIYDAITGEHIPPEQVEQEKSDGIKRTYELRDRTRANLIRHPQMNIAKLVSNTHIKIGNVDERFLPSLNKVLSNSIIEIDILHIQAENRGSDFIKFNLLYTMDQLFDREHGQRGEKYDAEYYGTIDERRDIDFKHFKLPNQPDNGNEFLINSYEPYWKLNDTTNGKDFNVPLDASFRAVWGVKPADSSKFKIVFNCTKLFNEEYCKNHGDFCYAVAIHYLDRVAN